MCVPVGDRVCVGLIELVGVIVGVTVDVAVGDILSVGESLNDSVIELVGVILGVFVGVDDTEEVIDGVADGLGVCDGVAEIGIPRIIMLSADKAAELDPTVTATTRQHTVGLLFAVKGIAGERIAVIHVPVGVVGVVMPKGVNDPKDPVVL
jgi:hypothetical protein